MWSLDHLSVLNALMHTSFSTSMRESTWAVMAMEAVHLVGLTLLGGPVIIVGLGAVRAEGLRGLSVSALMTGLQGVWALGLALMAVSGSLIAVAMPFKYYGNPAFRWKMVLLVMALVATTGLVRLSRPGTAMGRQLVWQRGLALAAALLWFGVGFSGRLIGFL
jgi:hypothetical protein